MNKLFAKIIRKMMISLFTKSSPEKLVKMGEARLIPVFQEAARSVPVYRKLLNGHAVDVSRIKDKESFKNFVPVIDKGIFTENDISDLCRNGDFDKAVSLSLSSGFSQEFSYSLMTSKELRSLAFNTDILLDYVFGVSKKKTLWLSALGMGVRVYTNLPLGEVSVRSDSILSFLKKISPYFEQTIISTSCCFAKKIIEEGCEQGINWKDSNVYFTIGEDWFPENFRIYLEYLLGVSSQDNIRILSNFGISELGLTLFGEDWDLIRIRRLAGQNKDFRYSLFGEGTAICPELMFYFPHQIFLEEIGGEFVFTTLNKNAIIPLIRYNSKDKGKIISYRTLKDVLAKFNYLDYLPEFKLPLVSVMGRSGKHIEINNTHFTPEQVKEGIYSDFNLAAAITGYFRMSKTENRLRIELQLKEKRAPEETLKQDFYQAIAKFIQSEFELIIYPYKDFPYSMGLIYENKFKYI